MGYYSYNVTSADTVVPVILPSVVDKQPPALLSRPEISVPLLPTTSFNGKIIPPPLLTHQLLPPRPDSTFSREVQNSTLLPSVLLQNTVQTNLFCVDIEGSSKDKKIVHKNIIPLAAVSKPSLTSCKLWSTPQDWWSESSKCLIPIGDANNYESYSCNKLPLQLLTIQRATRHSNSRI